MPRRPGLLFGACAHGQHMRMSTDAGSAAAPEDAATRDVSSERPGLESADPGSADSATSTPDTADRGVEGSAERRRRRLRRCRLVGDPDDDGNVGLRGRRGRPSCRGVRREPDPRLDDHRPPRRHRRPAGRAARPAGPAGGRRARRLGAPCRRQTVTDPATTRHRSAGAAPDQGRRISRVVPGGSPPRRSSCRGRRAARRRLRPRALRGCSPAGRRPPRTPPP